MKIKSNYRHIAITATSILCMCLFSGAYSLSQYTLICFSTPIICFATIALFSGLVMWKWRGWGWLTGSTNFLSNYLCHFVCVEILCLALFYICNYAFSDDVHKHAEKTIVEDKYYKVRHKTRRVSRNRYARGEAYNVYYMKVRFDNGFVKELGITRNRYSRLHKGDTVSLSVSNGFFGIPVVKGPF